MTFEQAAHLAKWQGAEIRHSGFHRGWVCVAPKRGEDELVAANPFSGQTKPIAISDHDRERADWVAGHGIAAL